MNGCRLSCLNGVADDPISRQGNGRLDRGCQKSKATAFRDTALVTLLNPKSIGFFVVFVPQFIDPAAPFTPQFTVMIATFLDLGGVNAHTYALLAATLRSNVARPDRMAWLQRGSGAVLIGLAIFTTTLRRA